MIEFLRENINWLKDLFTLIFAGTGTIVAILTYRRARATILQPIRTEVIKKQSEILTKLLQVIRDNNLSFDFGLDYVNLVHINVLLTLRDYGFIFKEQEEIFNQIQKDSCGWTPCGKSNVLRDVEVIGTFKEQDKQLPKSNDLGAERFADLKKGKIDIEKIYLTKLHSDFKRQISEVNNDPFMPSNIQNTFTELFNDIDNNLRIILKSELECFMIDFSKQYFEKGNAPKFNPIGVYNSFNHSRVHHRQTLVKLNVEIRKYLRIDEKW